MNKKNVLTCTGGGGRAEQALSRGFTMAEILLSLTIIGVVAAITLPSLTGNINERTWNTQRKALYARFSQAISLMPNLNGYGTLTASEDNAAETFVTAGLSKVLKLNNICDSDHLTDCGIPTKLNAMNGGVISAFPTKMSELNSVMTNMSYSQTGQSYSYEQTDTVAAGFETANGESIAVFYNPYCRSDLMSTAYGDYTQPKMCANFVYDLNGTKGPNTVGKDIGFITVFYPSDSVVAAPMPHVDKGKGGLSVPEAARYCTSLDSESRLPNRDEAASLFVNMNLVGDIRDESSTWLLTASKGVDSTNKMSVWTQSVLTGNRLLTPNLDKNGEAWAKTRCVKR
ncbi:MAG: type II secretion system GspH family protein [Fusobacterium sp.]|nr:type II secretion system GspH family protein [Fusobacterium sp.]